MHTYSSSLPALSELREGFKKAGFREPERIMTYLLKRQQEQDEPALERWFNRVLFNWTCRYGLYPGRPLRLLFAFAGLMSFVYLAALNQSGGSSLWAIWSNERVNKAEGQAEPARLGFARPFPPSVAPTTYYDMASGTWKTTDPLPTPTPAGRLSRLRCSLVQFGKAWGLALYFSLLSAFHFGWRDLNVGNWIARVQPHEYALRPTGWVRVVSGLQSLVSVYLVALWALSYFGRPFE